MKTDLTENELRFALAACMVHKLGVRSDVSDREMNELCGRSMEIVLAMKHGDEKAGQFVLAATARLSAVVATVLGGPGDKPTH